MRKQTGFTLVELMVTLAIIGILFATAVPVYHTWQQRAYGQEAMLMAKQILDGQIIYYLDNESFFPSDQETEIYIPDTDPGITQQNVQDILNALKISVPAGHKLGYQFINYGDYFQVVIQAEFTLFKDGYNSLFGQIDSSGKITIFPGFIGG